MWPFREKKRVLKKRTSGVSPKKRYAVRPKQESDEVSSFEWFPFLYRLLWILFLGVVIYIFVFSPVTALTTIVIEGNESVKTANIRAVVNEKMNGNLWKIFPRNRFATLQTNHLETALLERFPVMRSVSVVRRFPSAVTVMVHERITVAIWCSSEQRCFAVDEEGVAYAPVSEEGHLYDGTDVSQQDIVRIFDQSNQEVSSGDILFDENFALFARHIRSRLRDNSGIDIEQNAFTASRFSDRLTLGTSEGWTLSADVRIGEERLSRTMKLLLTKEIVGERRSKLKYVDMNNENRVYYSVDGETITDPKASAPVENE